MIQSCIYSRPAMQLLMGLCLGLALSLILIPFVEDLQCSVEHITTTAGPVVYTSTESAVNKAGMKPLQRPRFASTELGIKERVLFVVTTTVDSLHTRAVAVNKTVSPHPSKVLFFVTATSQSFHKPPQLPLVTFINERIVANQTLLKALHYVAEQYGTVYDWFFFTPDSVYMNSAKVVHFLDHISVAGYNLIGKPVKSVYPDVMSCDSNAGILMSSVVLKTLIDNLPMCTHVRGLDTVFDVESCLARVAHLLNITCTSQINELVVSFYSNNSLSSSDLRLLNQKNAFSNMLTVGLLLNHTDIYMVHRYVCEAEIEVTRTELAHVIREIAHVTPLTPDGNRSQSWPIDLDGPALPETRHDIVQWTYFTDTHIYAENDPDNLHELKGIDRYDINDVINIALSHLNNNTSATYEFRHVVNGYRRFDATRGMDYVLELALIEHVNSQSRAVVKQVGVLRPLGVVEIVPTPFVTENTRVHLVLPVAAGDRDIVLAFLDSYVRACVDAGDNADLLVVLIYPDVPVHHSANDDDIYAVVKSTIAFYESRFPQSDARIGWMSVVHEHAVVGSHSAVTAPFIVINSVMKRFPTEALVFFCSVGMEVSVELLNRIRMNTIVGFQVFFPIGFWSYKPSLIHDHPPYPASIEINSKSGYFDPDRVDHASFYCADYLAAQRKMADANMSPTDLYELFVVHHHGVHVLHAIEPALRLQYREDPVCKSPMDICPPRRTLASREQLALLVFEHQQRLDQQQIDIMHKQRDKNVAQMKPDML